MKNDQLNEYAAYLCQRGYKYLLTRGVEGIIIREENYLGYHESNVEFQVRCDLYNRAEVMGDSIRMRDISEIISRFTTMQPVRPESFYRGWKRIHFLNGLYLVDEGRFISMREAFQAPIDYYTPSLFRISHNFRDNAEPSQEMFDFLGKIFPDIETRQRWWEWLGYCLTTDVTSAKKAMFFLGRRHSGKSTLARVMREIIGENNWREKSIHALLESRWGLADTVGKLVVYDDDCGTQTIYRQHVLKTLTGHDILDVEQKGRQPYQAPNTAKLLVCGNARPKFKDFQLATASRWLECEFRWQFLPENEYNQLPEGSRDRCEPRDVDILEKLLDPDNIAGCINVALGYLSQLAERRFSFTGLTAEQMRDKWRAETDPVYGFLLDECERGVPVKDTSDADNVYEAFTHWCEEWGWDAISKSKFTREMAAAGHGAGRTRRGGKQVQYYRGVRLKNEVVEISEDFEDLAERLDLNDLL